MYRYCNRGLLCFLVLALIPGLPAAGTFNTPELHVESSPAQACSVRLEGVEKVVDSDISPTGPEVAALVHGKDRGFRLVFWRIGSQDVSEVWRVPEGFVPRAIAWHPRAECLFVMGFAGTLHRIARIEKEAKGWTAKPIYETHHELRRLVVGPSPFSPYYSDTHPLAYRLFLGMKNPNGSYRIVSITEHGKKLYQVIGPAETITDPGSEANPSMLPAESALPVGFHPWGHELIWEDGMGSFHGVSYDTKRWGDKSIPLEGGLFKGGSVTYTPNGLGLLHWQPSSPGIGLYLKTTKRLEQIAADIRFLAAPSSVPDGRGIVGPTKSVEGYALTYVPIAVPLPDVVNAWLFCGSAEDAALLEKYGGSFRGLGGLAGDQLFELYHSELYDPCGLRVYNCTQPSRPYLVTTDTFWELFAAAYEGLMVVQEREKAIPDFWKFVNAADQYYNKSPAPSRWKPVFKALADLRSKDAQNSETARIRNADTRQYSETLGIEVDYGELKPRGHYASSAEMQDYFKAFRYLTSVYANKPQTAEIMGELKELPKEAQDRASAWVSSYRIFIAPSRSPLVWKGGTGDQTVSTRHPSSVPSLFPLAWGFDNEVLYSTVYQINLPPEEQIVGPAGKRWSPSGLDVACALGSGFADSLLKTEYEKYPPLRRVMDNLRKRFTEHRTKNTEKEGLYERWMSALALQWADDVKSPNGAADEAIWRAKRLQTGLASWATLRHATVLVNERSDAQCGEGGFEEIVLRAPRGYVEPDPRTFGAIAGLFDAACRVVAEDVLKAPDTLPEADGKPHKGEDSLRQGIVRRLKGTAEKALLFRSIAEKQLRGEALTGKEYEEILYVGRIAEHHFLVFKSLGNKDHALSLPDPMPKIADVAGGELAPFLMAAVGKPVEWDHVVPYFGRRQIVKGAVYSYYEFKSDSLLNDEEWRGKVDSQERPGWITPFFLEHPPRE